MRSADGQRRARAPARTSRTRAARRAHEHRARLADEPDAERAALEHEPGPRVQLARVVADEVAEQPERASARARRSRARLAAARTFAPRCAYSSGIAHACASSANADRERQRLHERTAGPRCR